MRQLPPMNAIKGFEAVVRLGNHNNAAAELGVTHGAISRQVRVLEDYFGCKLFQTSGRQLVPTELARFYANEIGAALDRISQATARVREPAAARLVRVSGTSSVIMHWLVPRMSEFLSAHPAIEVSLSASTGPMEQLITTNDIILRRWPLLREGYECRALFRDRRILVCAPGLAERRNFSKPADIFEETLLYTDGRQQAGNWERWMLAHGLTAPKRLKRIKFDHVFVSIEAVMNGLGVALLSQVLMEPYLRSGALVELFPEKAMPYPNLYALFPVSEQRTPSVKTFLRWMIAEGEKVSGPFEEADPYSAGFDQADLALN